MSYLVVVTFDLETAESKDYDCVKEEFAKINLYPTIKDENNKEFDLTKNTFAGKLEGQNTNNIRDNILSAVKSIFKNCKVKGRIFVSVGGNWAWGIANV